MRKIHKLLLPAIIFMMAIIQVKAQGTAGIDVIPNGGFEKWQVVFTLLVDTQRNL